MDLSGRREAAQREHARQLQQRLDSEREVGERERERQLIESLAAGEGTDRMKRAEAILRYLRTLSSGRWVSHGESQIVHDTQLDNGEAVRLADPGRAGGGRRRARAVDRRHAGRARGGDPGA